MITMKRITVRYSTPMNRHSGALVLNTKFTRIIGDSGEGKTTLIQDLRANDTIIEVSDGYSFLRIPELSFGALDGVSDLADYVKGVLNATTMGRRAVFYCDEDISYLSDSRVQKMLANYPAYFLLIGRYNFAGIPYSYHCLKNIVSEKIGDHYVTCLKEAFQGFDEIPENVDSIKNIYLEDSKSGCKVYDKYAGWSIGSVGGKDRVEAFLNEIENTLIIADGVGIGSSIEKIYGSLVRNANKNNALLLISSFEGMVLASDFMRSYKTDKQQAAAKILAKLKAPVSKRERKAVYNMEARYELILDQLMRDLGLSPGYSKGSIPKCLYLDCCWRLENCCGNPQKGKKCRLILSKIVQDCIDIIRKNRFEAPLKDFESEVAEFQSSQGLTRENPAGVTSAFDDL